jgi:hypothetical protein
VTTRQGRENPAFERGVKSESPNTASRICGVIIGRARPCTATATSADGACPRQASQIEEHQWRMAEERL